LAERFEKDTGIKVNVVTQSSSGEGLVKLQAERDNPTIDVWFTTNAVAATAATDQKLFTKIPQDKIGNISELIDGAHTDDWVAAYYYPLGIIYNADTVPFEPKEWQDLWKPELAHTIIAPSMSIYQGSLLLVANQLNNGTMENVDPGFAAIEKLNPNVSLYYTSDSQARQSMAQGEGSILIGQSAHFHRLKEEGMNVKMITPAPAPLYLDVMMMVNGKNQDNAAKFINYVISEKEQSIMGTSGYMPPVNKNSKSSPALEAVAPAKGTTVVFDGAAIAAHIADWQARFEKIVTQ